jgi:hypothetical protein
MSPTHDPYEVVDVTSWAPAPPFFETAGRKQSKRWLRDPAGDLWLFKAVTRQTLPDGQTWLKGENWAEKIVCEIGVALGTSVAHVELAIREATAGSIARDFTEGKKSQLALGNELLGGVIPGYDRSAFHRVEDYTVGNVLAALAQASVGAPPGPASDVSAEGCFAGYLVLDALVANTDRHHQNWGVLLRPDGSLLLAPSFDHASSLGFQLSDADRTGLLEHKGRGVDAFVRRGRSRHVPGKPSFVDLAVEAATRSSTLNQWRRAVESVSVDQLKALVNRVPQALMSHPSRTFAMAVLDLNRRRLLDALAAP